jgi:hypothetical protein
MRVHFSGHSCPGSRLIVQNVYNEWLVCPGLGQVRLLKSNRGCPDSELHPLLWFIRTGYAFEYDVTEHHPDGSTTKGRIDLYKRACFALESKQFQAAKAASRQGKLARLPKGPRNQVPGGGMVG